MEQNTTQNAPMPEMKLVGTELPSRGLGYPEGTVFYYRSYTFGEIKKISLTNDVDLAQIVEATMSGIRCEGLEDKYQMSFIDMLYIGLLRRVSSQGHIQFQLPYQCEKCGNEAKAIFGAGDIEFQAISEDVPALPLVTEIGGKEVHFIYPTVRAMLDAKTGKLKIKGEKNSSLNISASGIINMKFEDAYALLKNVSTDDEMEILNEVDTLLFHDIKPVKSVCKSKVTNDDNEETTCNHTNHVSIEGKELLIRPFRDGEGHTRTKIRFGNK